MLAQSPVQRVSQSCVAGVRKQSSAVLLDASDSQASYESVPPLFLVCVDTLACVLAQLCVEDVEGDSTYSVARRTTVQSCASVQQSSEH